MTPDLTPQQAAHLAEARIWSVLITTDTEITSQLGPSRVRDLATLRLAFLDQVLAGLPSEGRDDLLEYALTDDQRAQAFADAAGPMHEVLSLIGNVVSLEGIHGVA
jgi:hypothetical protein